MHVSRRKERVLEINQDSKTPPIRRSRNIETKRLKRELCAEDRRKRKQAEKILRQSLPKIAEQ